jgi:hypothetical protein
MAHAAAEAAGHGRQKRGVDVLASRQGDRHALGAEQPTPPAGKGLGFGFAAVAASGHGNDLSCLIEIAQADRKAASGRK